MSLQVPHKLYGHLAVKSSSAVRAQGSNFSEASGTASKSFPGWTTLPTNLTIGSRKRSKELLKDLDMDVDVDVRPLYCRLQKVGIWIWDDSCGPSCSIGFGVGGRSYSNFLASTATAASFLTAKSVLECQLINSMHS